MSVIDSSAESQTASLQRVIDGFPDCFFAEDMAKTASDLAKGFIAEAKGDEVLTSAANELLMVGQQLQSEGGGPSDPAHSGIAGLYCTGSEGRSRFLAAYAKCYRRSWDLSVKRGSVWNTQYWVDAIKDTFKYIGNGIGKLGEGIGEGLGKLVIQLLPLIAVIIVLAIVVLVVQKKVTS